jgi:hypothetical protein
LTIASDAVLSIVTLAAALGLLVGSAILAARRR